jgi:hypothetical protein
MAGTVEDGVLDRIRGELDTKFQGQASPDLLKSVPSTGGVVAYSYLFKVLPFQWAFDRFSDKLQFQGRPVESFGIEQLTKKQENEVRASAQVSVLDYQDSDDFIIELRTRVPGDRLILAKIPPSDTLQSTVREVQNRVSRSKAEPMPESSNLYVPILDFQILKDYGELRGKPIKATNLILNGQSLAIALQSIRFRLDERGAALKSEAALMMCAGMTDLCFDKPFLVLLERDKAWNPYLTLWIGNTDLMSPGTPTTM